MKFLIFTAILLFYNFQYFTLYSKNEIYALVGKVIDAETGEPLRGATIQVLEIPRGTFSDPQGNFRLSDLPINKFSLKITYLGYQTKIIKEIEKEKAKDLKVSLYPEIKVTEEVTVEAQRLYDNQESLLSLRKGSNKVIEAISIEEIKRLSDGNVAQALKRIPGVSLFNDFIIVRGINERYNNASINGSPLPSTEVDKKSFSFDLIPSDFVENISVYKSYSPELPANFAGGLVEINTNDFPSNDFLKFSLSSKSNSNTTLKKNRFQTYTGGKLDWLGFEDGSRNLPAGFPSDRLEMNKLLNNANNPFDTTNSKEILNRLMQNLFSRSFKIQNKTILPLDDKSFNLFFGKTISINSFDLGITGSARFLQDFLIIDLTKNTYLSNFDTLYSTAGTQSIQKSELGGMLNLGLRNENNIITLKNNFINTSENEVLLINGRDMGYQFLEFKNFSFHFTQKSLIYLQLSGQHNYNPMNLNVNWQVNISNLIRKEPDYRRFKFSRFLSDVSLDPNTPYLLEILPNQQGDGTRAGRFYSNLNERLLNAKIDLIYTYDRAKVKFGLFYNKQNRTFNARSITITSSPTLSEEVYQRLTEYWNLDSVFAPINFNYDQGLRIGEDSKLSDSYNAKENLIAGYLVADIPFILFHSLKIRFISGFRIENNILNLNSFNIDNSLVNVDYRTNDILPAFNLILETSKSSNLRFAVSQTLSRPGYREYAPFAFYDYFSMSLVQGNPNLNRSKISNFDLRWEIFPDISEVFSVGLFYKIFDNAIEETIYPQQSELTRTFANAEGIAKNFGLELELRKNLGFISHLLNDFQFSGNFSLVSSQITIPQGGIGTQDKRKMWGQSPYTLNLGLYYKNHYTRTTISVGYNTFGKRIVQVVKTGVYQANDPHIYELPTHNLDFTITQNLSPIELRLSVKNLLNSRTEFEQNGKRWTSLYYGTSISFGITYSPF
ncbi:MAG: carboxypeptidase-like regulatory domain-containing protein [Candidatus Kapaibacteriales bacterium]